MKSPTPKASPFTNVGHILANGKPLPIWLIQDLERESPLIACRKSVPGDEDEDRALLAAVKDLERRLVWEVHVHDIIEKKWPGLPAPMFLDETMNKLTELAQYLEDQLRPPRKGGQTPDNRRRVCALMHGVGFTVRCSRLASGFGKLAKSTGRRVVIPKPAPAAD